MVTATTYISASNSSECAHGASDGIQQVLRSKIPDKLLLSELFSIYKSNTRGKVIPVEPLAYQVHH